MVGLLDVDPVGVGAVSGGRDLRISNGYARAPEDQNVKQLAVQRGDAADEHIFRPADSCNPIKIMDVTSI